MMPAIEHPRSVVCPNCNAKVHENCTQPTDSGRRSVEWHHTARITAVTQKDAHS